MALHLNLYHEILGQRRQRQRDPMRFAIFGVVLTALLATGHYFYRAASVNRVVDDAGKLQAEWEILEPKQQRAEQLEEALIAEQKLADDLVARIENRFLWGPVLQSLVEVVPYEVQITRLEAESTPEGPQPLALTITGISAGPEPRTVAEELRIALASKFGGEKQTVDSTFRSLEDTENLVQIDGRSFPTALFSIGVSVSNQNKTTEKAL
jgi:Tfp pilus assembly protein PilN